MADYGNPPYHETAAKAALRLLLSGASGWGAVPGGANFGTAFLASGGRSAIAAQQASQAAERYALAQEETKRRAQEDAMQAKFMDAQIQQMAKEKPPPPERPQAYVPTTEADALRLYEAQRQIDAKYKAQTVGKSGNGGAGMPPEDMSWLKSYVRTSSGGNEYLDLSSITKDKPAALRWASNQGIPVAGSAEVSQLQDIESAKGNISSILDDLHGLLPPDAAARAQQYPSIRLSQLFQTNAARTAFNSWRGAAIRNLRAVAGSKGLRLNQKEIDIAVRNDIPQITDTWEVANRKMETVLKGLDNAERPILRMNLSKGRSGTASPKDPLGVLDANGQ